MKLYLPLLRMSGMSIRGTPRYIGKDVIFDGNCNIILGDRVVISNECFFLTHDYSITTAMISIGEKPNSDIQIVKKIEIGNNVFIGKRSIIMPGVKIGNNVIVGAGSVVRGEIPDNTIVMGNPSQIIGNTKELALKWKKYFKTNQIFYD